MACILIAALVEGWGGGGGGGGGVIDDNESTLEIFAYCFLRLSA